MMWVRHQKGVSSVRKPAQPIVFLIYSVYGAIDNMNEGRNRIR